MIFQSYAIWPNMTVAENVAFGLKLRKFDRATRYAPSVEADARRRCGSAASPTATRPNCRGGQQQRVALAPRHGRRAARAAARRAAVQPRRQSARGDALRDPAAARRFSITTVYVTHDQAEAMVDVRPHRRDEPGPSRADRRAARAVHAARRRASSPASSAEPTFSKGGLPEIELLSIISTCRAGCFRLTSLPRAARSCSPSGRTASRCIARRVHRTSTSRVPGATRRTRLSRRILGLCRLAGR